MTRDAERDLEREIERTSAELAERYEEINLLYTISEILGRTVSLDRAAATILREVTETVGAKRGTIVLATPDGTALEAIATVGVAGLASTPVDARDSVAARAFREHRVIVVGPDEETQRATGTAGAVLAVPITWTVEAGRTDLLGVMTVAERTAGGSFSAGDVKLVTAIATQIAAAIQNARLVEASLEQQRLLQEVRLAHDLQMRLLPRTTVVAPQAAAAARVVPAESVGGDFYHLFRLTPTATGVMIGDVSSHGYRAALIMALTMSAAAIHAQSTLDPGAMLHALLQSLADELTSTEMFVSLFYGIVDTEAGVLEYANAGHPHAFRCRQNGETTRLAALDPPLGMTDGAPQSARVEWDSERDLLVLFTDGFTDALDARGVTMGETAMLDIVRRNCDQPPDVVLERVFDALYQHVGDVPPRDDLTLLVLRA